ncbi:hypothetical protein D5086_004608 [Populus alba]|uniref:Uncharacterized protein n=3 Tax=Populus alba TaxID=43335 RepID=A0ACC4CT18_POPAL|nr:hypothetical protein D5086_0000224070 [Populus alba]
MFCLLASSSRLLLSFSSERMSCRVDYAGIDSLTSTSFYPPGDCSFTRSRILQGVYMGFITVLGFVAVIFTLFPVFPRPDFRSSPAALFLGTGLSGVATIFHKLMHYKKQPEALQTTGFEILMGILDGIRRIDKRTPREFLSDGSQASSASPGIVTGLFTC